MMSGKKTEKSLRVANFMSLANDVYFNQSASTLYPRITARRWPPAAALCRWTSAAGARRQLSAARARAAANQLRVAAAYWPPINETDRRTPDRYIDAHRQKRAAPTRRVN